MRQIIFHWYINRCLDRKCCFLVFQFLKFSLREGIFILLSQQDAPTQFLTLLFFSSSSPLNWEKIALFFLFSFGYILVASYRISWRCPWIFSQKCLSRRLRCLQMYSVLERLWWRMKKRVERVAIFSSFIFILKLDLKPYKIYSLQSTNSKVLE